MEVGMKTRRFYLLLTVALVVLAAACGGSDEGGDDENANSATITTAAANDQGNDAGTTTTSPQDEGGSEPQDQPAVGEAGSFTVNGTEFAVTLLNRCIPFQDKAGDIDLQALAGGPRAKLNLYLLGVTTEVSVDGSTIQDMFGSIAFGEAPTIAASEVIGNRWTGSATVADSLGSGKTVDLTWDVMVPDEIRDCSL